MRNSSDAKRLPIETIDFMFDSQKAEQKRFNALPIDRVFMSGFAFRKTCIKHIVIKSVRFHCTNAHLEYKTKGLIFFFFYGRKTLFSFLLAN